MRGKIIQYNGADGSGTIVADGRQYRFALATWRGDSAPAINRTVEFAPDGDADAVTAVTAVGEDVLLKEKAAELGGKLGSLWNKIPAGAAAGPPANDAVPVGAAAATAAPAPGSGGTAIAGSIIQRYGKAILIAYVLFLIGSLFFNAVAISMGPMNMGKSFFDIASLFSQVGAAGGGSIKLLLILGYLSIAVPMFWRDRRAWLALAIPLLAVVWAIFSILHTLDSLGGGIGEGMADAFSLGFGFWLTLLAAIALAGLGIKRSFSAA